MSKTFVFLLMVFLHIVNDFNMQDSLADLKQKSWWEKNYPDPKYKYDYRAALVIHALSWSFMMMLPVAIYYNFNVGYSFVAMMASNTILHFLIDDLKANEGVINLITDQALHVVQIVITFIILLCVR